MAYNIFCETEKEIHWQKLNLRLQPFSFIEYVPMPGLAINGGDALGLSVPQKNVGDRAWREMQIVVEILINEFQFVLYDMYQGEIIDLESLDNIRAAIGS